MVARDCGKGGGRACSRGRDSGGGRGHGDKGPHYYAHYGRNNHTSDKYWTSLVNLS